MAFMIGDSIRCGVTIRVRSTGQLADPTELLFQLRKSGDLAPTTYKYSLGEMIRDGLGQFHIDVTPAITGRYRFRWHALGAVAAASEGSFIVTRSKVL